MMFVWFCLSETCSTIYGIMVMMVLWFVGSRWAMCTSLAADMWPLHGVLRNGPHWIALEPSPPVRTVPVQESGPFGLKLKWLNWGSPFWIHLICSDIGGCRRIKLKSGRLGLRLWLHDSFGAAVCCLGQQWNQTRTLKSTTPPISPHYRHQTT